MSDLFMQATKRAVKSRSSGSSPNRHHALELPPAQQEPKKEKLTQGWRVGFAWGGGSGHFVSHLPQDEAVASRLGTEEGGLDPNESWQVVDLLNGELSRVVESSAPAVATAPAIIVPPLPCHRNPTPPLPADHSPTPWAPSGLVMSSVRLPSDSI
ncbi:hypothetical protein NL676_029704 [Syzygium grande]|nr:hypothetical protein NL676_029704 [Syzygium grande]